MVVVVSKVCLAPSESESERKTEQKYPQHNNNNNNNNNSKIQKNFQIIINKRERENSRNFLNREETKVDVQYFIHVVRFAWVSFVNVLVSFDTILRHEKTHDI